MNDMNDTEFEQAASALEQAFEKETAKQTAEFDALDSSLDQAFGTADAAFEDLRKEIAEGTDE